MRNLKKILALVMALVMSLSLVTIANASDFTDADDITYAEAADVMSTIGVIEGFEDGSFDPDGTLTREQAAKMVTYMLLGDNAENLGIERSSFNDVAMDRWSAPAIEYCVSLGIIDGAGDGNFYPAAQLTGAAFAKMLLTALGYDADTEGLVGATWSVNTAALAMEVGLDNGIETLNWNDPLSREEAAQMGLNAICAPLVAYEGGVTVVVGDTPVSFGSGDAYYITTTLAREQRISDEQLSNSNDYTVEFGERYFPRLRLVRETDEFERPSHTWVYENTELGTYVDYELLVETYTAGVSGRTLYELLSRSTIEDYDFTYYVDGVVNTTLNKNDMVRSNTDDVGQTGNGVLTQVFVDHDDMEIVITSINTWLAQANADYNENSETLSLKVFQDNSDGVTKTVDSNDVANAVDVVEDQFVLVNMSRKDRAQLEVVKISDVEILTDVTVTKFSTERDSATVESLFSSLTADGEEYDASAMAEYDDEVLNLYDASLLTDMSYNVYLDQYGYAIGVDLYEGEANYVFITGYDRGRSHISIKTAQAAAIFLDGSMEEITVNVTNTNKNIMKLDDNKDNIPDDPYYHEWVGDGEIALNTWYTYSVDANNNYTLRPVEGRMFATRYDFVAQPEVTINCANVRLTDTVHGTSGRAYGNDNSVYITVEPGRVDESRTDHDAIVDVNGLYTGVQNVEIELTDELNGELDYSVYTLKDNDDYIIGSIVLGDAMGSTANYAYILSEAKSEGIEDGTYYWEFDAVLGGEEVTLTARSKYPNTIDELTEGDVQELRFDGEYVVAVKDITPRADKFITRYTTDWDDHEVYFVNYTNDETITLTGRTFKSNGAGDQGLAIVSESMPTVLEQQVNGKWTTTNYSSMAEALAAMGDAQPNVDGQQFDGFIVGVFDSVGRLEWAYIYSRTPVTSGIHPGYGNSHSISNGDATLTVDRTNTGLDFRANSIYISSLGRLTYTFTAPVGYTVTSYDFRIYVDDQLVDFGTDASPAQSGTVVTGVTSYGWLPYDAGDKVLVIVDDIRTNVRPITAVDVINNVPGFTPEFIYGAQSENHGGELDNVLPGTNVTITITKNALRGGLGARTSTPATELVNGNTYWVQVNGEWLSGVCANGKLTVVYTVKVNDTAITVQQIVTDDGSVTPADKYTVTVPAAGATVAYKGGADLAAGANTVKAGSVIVVTPNAEYTVKVNGAVITKATDYTVNANITITAEKKTQEPSTGTITDVTVGGTEAAPTFTVDYASSMPDKKAVIDQINAALDEKYPDNTTTVDDLFTDSTGTYAMAEGKSVGKITYVGTFKVLYNGVQVGSLKEGSPFTYTPAAVRGTDLKAGDKLIISGEGNVDGSNDAFEATVGLSGAVTVDAPSPVPSTDKDITLVKGYAVTLDTASAPKYAVTVADYTLPGSSEKVTTFNSSRLFPMGTTFTLTGTAKKANGTNVVLTVNGEAYGSSQTTGDAGVKYTYTLNAAQFTKTAPNSFMLAEKAVTNTTINIGGTNITVTTYDDDGTFALPSVNSALDGSYIVLKGTKDTLNEFWAEEGDLVKIETKLGASGSPETQVNTTPVTINGAYTTEGVALYLVKAADYSVTFGAGVDYEISYSSKKDVTTGLTPSTAYFFPASGCSMYVGDMDDTDGYRIVKEITGRPDAIVKDVYTVGDDTFAEDAASKAVTFTKEDYVASAQLGATIIAVDGEELPIVTAPANTQFEVTVTINGVNKNPGNSTVDTGNEVVYTIKVIGDTGYYVDADTELKLHTGDKATVSAGSYNSADESVTFTVSYTVA